MLLATEQDVCSRSSDYFRLRITTAGSKARWLFLFVAAGSDPLTKETHISSDKRSIDEHYMYRLAEKLGQYIQKSHLDRPLSQLLARNFIASSVCCSESDLHLALPAPQRYGLTDIIAYWGGNCKSFQKITAAVLDNGGKLWYNAFSNRAKCLLSEQFSS